MKPDIQKRLKEFYNNLSDRPLNPGDRYYVPFLEGRGDPIQNLSTKIGWSEAASVNLVTGQRGSGKSTELRRLKKLLEDNGCVVFLCDMSLFMNLTTAVEITDFFISIMGALSEAVGGKYGEDPSHEGFWERFKNFLQTEVLIESIKVEGGIKGFKTTLAASLKDDPSFRQTLQQKSRGHVAKIIQQTNVYATEIVEYVRQKESDPNKKVVLLVDSVEQIRGVGTDAESVYKSVENLFSGHADKLHLPLLHVVYTIPPYLTPIVPGLGRLLGGGTVCNLPSIHVRRRNAKTNTCNKDENGLKIMQDVISRRCSKWTDFFSAEQMNRIALATGGDLREFFRMVRECLVQAANDEKIPLTDDILLNVENMLRRDMLPIATEDMKWLKEIMCSKRPNLEKIQELPRLARFFDTHLVLNYRNDDDWYDIHPLIQKEIGG